MEARADAAVLIPINPSAALTKRVVWDSGAVSGSLRLFEGDAIYDIFDPETGIEYVAQSTRDPETESEVTVYYTEIGKWALEDIQTHVYERAA